MKTSELSYKENTKRCVWVAFETIEFYWEAGTAEVLLSGKGYDGIKIHLEHGYESQAKDARKEIAKYLTNAFGV